VQPNDKIAIAMNNPLLHTDDLPRFRDIRPELVEPAVDEVLADNRRQLAALLEGGGPYTWDNLVEPIERMGDRLQKVWSPVSHLNSVMNSEPLRAAYNACLPKLSAYQTELGQNRALFEAFRQLRESDEYTRLDQAGRQTIDHALRDFRLAGVALPDERKRRFGEIALRLSELSSRFQENLLDATNAWHRTVTDEAELTGIPDSARAMMRQAAERAGESGWHLGLDFPTFFAVMSHADNRELRREMYEAWVTRASEIGPSGGRFDNLPMMEEILALRHEQARLLGFDNYAELSLEPKMAESTEAVMSFLNDLADRSLPAAREEYAELERFARDEHGLPQLEAWDTGYYAEKLRRARFDLSPEDLRPYFPADRVVRGLFEVVERLYGIRIERRDDVDVWHEDVQFFEIRDAGGELRGQFFTDLYARPNKRGGAWMDSYRGRFRYADGLQLPVAYLTCNFTPSVGGRPALLSHDEVQTLFHEFGHGLHHMLTRVDAPSVAGINGVAWDAVELPSQFMENWTWEREALDLFAAHHETGERIPEALYQRMVRARNFQSAMQMVRQLEFSLFDMRLHLEYSPQRGARIYPILGEVRDQVAVAKAPEFNRFPNSFAHIFAGGYAAGYYSYKWAEVLSADAYSRFEEEGIFNRDTGRAFLQNILEKGGSEDAMALFKAFRGREPSIEPLLRHSGLAA
jgi:oligopeptidase A